MHADKSLKLGQILLEEGLITHDQLLEALELQQTNNRKLGDIFIDKGLLSDQQIAQVLANTYHLPFVKLTKWPINENLLGLIPFEVLKKLKVLPIELKDQNLSVATNNPLDIESLQEIQYLSGYHIKPVMAGIKDIEEHLDRLSGTMQTVHLIQGSKEGGEAAPILTLVESLINKAIKERASDIHLEPMDSKLRVRFRIDGILYEKTPIPKDMERKVLSRIKILSGLDVADSRRPQDGRMSIPFKFNEYDIRVATLPGIIGENMVLRILDKSFNSYSFETLGMDHAQIETMTQLINRPYGIVLVTGPTGSGKTTTLYSMLNLLNQTSRNIITVEDPMEYKIQGINQTAINPLSGYTFATAIRHILRHDPNVIMVGEIRDSETAEIAIRAALTGHLVLSTLHTNTASGAIMRLLDMKVEPFLIRSALIAVVAQRLVRRLCPICYQKYPVTEEIRKNLSGLDPAIKTFASAFGCEQCLKTGYKGRIGLYELLVINDPIRDLILKSPSEQEINHLAVQKGMTTLRASGIQKVGEQITSLEEIMSTTFMEKD